MNGFVIEWKYDGYINGVPYDIERFDKKYLHDLDLDMDIFQSLQDLNPLQKLVYIFINSFSCNDARDGFPLVYYRVTSEEIADVIKEPVPDVEETIRQLIDKKRLSVLSIEGELDAYMAL